MLSEFLSILGKLNKRNKLSPYFLLRIIQHGTIHVQVLSYSRSSYDSPHIKCDLLILH